MKILIAGCGGLIGQHLIQALSGNELVALKRPAGSSPEAAARAVEWDPAQPAAGNWRDEISSADAVVNLAGESIAACRWSASRKKALIQSRLSTTRALAEAIAASARKPSVFVNASAIGVYGARDEKPVDEGSPAARGFLPDLCAEWERQARKAEASGVRVVLLRTGIVLAKEGGALAKMLPLFRLGLGGPLGDGKQYMSWIHIDDEVNAIAEAIRNPKLSGPVNLVSPQAVPMKEFARELGRVLKRPAVLPAPAFVLKLLLGEMSELLLTGQNVVPSRLAAAGYRFRHPTLAGALHDLLAR